MTTLKERAGDLGISAVAATAAIGYCAGNTMLVMTSGHPDNPWFVGISLIGDCFGVTLAVFLAGEKLIHRHFRRRDARLAAAVDRAHESIDAHFETIIRENSTCSCLCSNCSGCVGA